MLRLASAAGAAVAGVGTAGLNGVVGATTPTSAAPPAPADLVVTGTSETTISLEWAVPDGAAVDHFTTFVDGNGYPLVENDRPSVFLAGLDPDTTHELAVESVGSDGTASARTTTTATTDSFDVDGLEVTQFAVGLSEETGDVRDHAEVASYEGDDGERTVVISGRLSDARPCTFHSLGEVSFEEGTLSVLVTDVPVGPSDCGPAFVPDEYAIDVALTEAPDAVEVRHPDWRRSATIEGWKTPEIEGERPRDLDRDGRYMDLNANGRLDLGDAVTYYEHRNRPALADRPDRFDYDGDGDCDGADVIALLREV